MNECDAPRTYTNPIKHSITELDPKGNHAENCEQCTALISDDDVYTSFIDSELSCSEAEEGITSYHIGIQDPSILSRKGILAPYYQEKEPLRKRARVQKRDQIMLILIGPMGLQILCSYCSGLKIPFEIILEILEYGSVYNLRRKLKQNLLALYSNLTDYRNSMVSMLPGSLEYERVLNDSVLVLPTTTVMVPSRTQFCLGGTAPIVFTSYYRFGLRVRFKLKGSDMCRAVLLTGSHRFFNDILLDKIILLMQAVIHSKNHALNGERYTYCYVYVPMSHKGYASLHTNINFKKFV